MIEEIKGPFAGYYVAVCVRETGEPGDRFLTSYKICRERPADYASAVALRANEVAGSSNTVLEAQEIAVQLAVLQIGMWSRRPGARALSEPRLHSVPVAAPLYQPTMPCPLLPEA